MSVGATSLCSAATSISPAATRSSVSQSTTNRVTATRRLALRELRRLARLVQAGLLALDLACVPREEAFALQRDAQLRVRLDERAGDPVPDGSGLSGQAAAVDTDA